MNIDYRKRYEPFMGFIGGFSHKSPQQKFGKQ